MIVAIDPKRYKKEIKAVSVSSMYSLHTEDEKKK